jgi:hypothetical protein
MGKNDIKIEVTHREERGRFYSLPNGGKVYISNIDIVFLEQLQDLPYQTKIRMMCLEEEEMEKFIIERKANDNKFLIELLSKKWYDRCWDIPLQIENDMIEGVPYTGKQILKISKSKKPLTRKQILAVINFLVGDKAEYYTKED